MATQKEFIQVENVSKYYPLKSTFGKSKEFIKAVDNVSLTIRKGETLGLVGESGSGKSTLGRMILQIEQATKGTVFYDQSELTSLSKKELVPFHKRMQIIFQDPYSALNPHLTALELVMEPLKILYAETDTKKTATEILDKVGITGDSIHKYPQSFSGGQRQRIGIARALSVHPEFILCDEPISALDVSIQAQIINLLVDLQKSMQLTYLFISHDLSMVKYISDRIAVMYLGNIVELGTTEQIFTNPQHSYTKKLLAAIPIADPVEARKKQALENQQVNEKSVLFNPEEATVSQQKLTQVAPDHFVRK